MNVLDAAYLLVLAVMPALYWALPRRRRLAGLSLMSVTALAWFSWPSALALMGVTALTYAVHARRVPGTGMTLVAIASLVLVFLGYKALPLFEQHAPPLLFIGMVFYLLKALRVLIDRYRDPTEPPVTAELFCAYMLFLPTLLIGPIHGLRQFQGDWRQQAYSARRTSIALERLLWGYAKIVLLGSCLVNRWFAGAIAVMGSTGDWPRLYEYLSDLRYGLHLYFTFAGASDVAIAFAALLGFRIEENFNHPFASSSITEFWRRWHMSLSNWARHYIYAPLAALTRHHMATLILTMGLIGFWHEFSARYVIWGAYHGFGLVVHHGWVALTHRSQAWETVRVRAWYRVLAICITFQFVTLGFGITRAATGAEFLVQLRRLVWGAS